MKKEHLIWLDFQLSSYKSHFLPGLFYFKLYAVTSARWLCFCIVHFFCKKLKPWFSHLEFHNKVPLKENKENV